MNDLVVGAVGAVALFVFVMLLASVLGLLRLWLQAALTGTPVSFAQIIGMRLRKSPPQLIVHALIALHQRGEAMSAQTVEACYLAFGAGTVTTAAELVELVLEKRAPLH